MSGLSTKPFAIRWKPVVLKGLGDGEVAAIFKTAVPSISTLPKVVAVSIT